MKCWKCSKPVEPSSRFCGECAAAQPDDRTRWHYSGHAGQAELPVDGVVERLLAHPDRDHHLWREGYDGWRSWAEVPYIAAAVARARELAEEHPGRVAEYTDVLRDMLSDGILEPWELDELTRLREHLKISPATHERLVERHRVTVERLLDVRIDRAGMTAFRVGHSCVLQVRLANVWDRGLRRVSVQVATSTEGRGMRSDSERLSPGAVEPVTVRLMPELAGQHELLVLLQVEPYSGERAFFRSRPVIFAVAPEDQVAQTQVFNIDLSAMQVGKIGDLTARVTSEAGLVEPGSWHALDLIPLRVDEARDWLLKHVGTLPGDFPEATEATEPEGGSAVPSLPAVLHYSGPDGQVEERLEAIARRICTAPEAAHHVWSEGWPSWRPWDSVPALLAKVRSRDRPTRSGWHPMSRELRERLVADVLPDRLLVYRHDRRPMELGIECGGVPVVLEGIDARPVVEAGLCQGYSRWNGEKVAFTDTAALLVGGFDDLLRQYLEQPVFKRENLNWLRFLRRLLLHRDRAGAVDALGYFEAAESDSILFRSDLLAAGLWATGQHERLRGLVSSEAWHRKEPWQCARVQGALFHDRRSVCVVLSRVEQDADVREAAELDSLGALAFFRAAVYSHLLNEPEAARQALVDVRPDEPEDAVCIAYAAAFLLDAPRLVARSLARADALSDSDELSAEDSVTAVARGILAGAREALEQYLDRATPSPVSFESTRSMWSDNELLLTSFVSDAWSLKNSAFFAVRGLRHVVCKPHRADEHRDRVLHVYTENGYDEDMVRFAPYLHHVEADQETAAELIVASEEAVRRALLVDPDEFKVSEWTDLALSAHGVGRPKLMERALREASAHIEPGPRAVWGMLELAAIWHWAGRVDECTRCLERASDLAGTVSTLLALARAQRVLTSDTAAVERTIARLGSLTTKREEQLQVAAGLAEPPLLRSDTAWQIIQAQADKARAAPIPDPARFSLLATAVRELFAGRESDVRSLLDEAARAREELARRRADASRKRQEEEAARAERAAATERRQAAKQQVVEALRGGGTRTLLEATGPRRDHVAMLLEKWQFFEDPTELHRLLETLPLEIPWRETMSSGQIASRVVVLQEAGATVRIEQLEPAAESRQALRLDAVGDRRVAVLVALRKVWQLDLVASKALADSAPVELPEPAVGSIEDAMQKLQAAGARVSLQGGSP